MCDIGLLRCLIATAQQNNKGLAMFAVIHALTTANINPQF